MDQLGKRIKKKREDLGLLVKELSSHIGMTPSLISQIESRKAFPSIVTLKKLSDVLQTTVGELIGEHDNLSQHPLLKSNERRFVIKEQERHQFKNIRGKEAEMLWIITPNNNKINSN